jgi:hypothetical protein
MIPCKVVIGSGLTPEITGESRASFKITTVLFREVDKGHAGANARASPIGKHIELATVSWVTTRRAEGHDPLC